MAKINLDKLTYRELAELSDAVAEAMAIRKDQEKNELKRKLAEFAEESGFSLDEVLGNTRGRRGGKGAGQAVVKYRNPKDSSQTWTGRGRKPNWLVEALSKGQKLDSFAA